MAKYLLAFHGGSMPATEKVQAKVMAAWGKWMGKLGPALVDPGNPVGQTKVMASDGTVKAAGRSKVTGYSIIEAKDMATALKLSKGCPILKAGGTIEVAETFDAM